ncbi:cytidine deaminase [uncultured Megasphaera sp.]|jgi:cytidine deaminase|uniref:cytidine deaminase n=1 Tax=uncultured Megasphaera sp. TaxID=165188 RepID=UPI0025F5A9B7|nr:cytidine deaminase [uncultured Megasphaera sp.]
MVDEKTVARLIRAARDVQERAYAPYSHFRVGAALLGEDGTVYTGCNVENASYGLTICAERNAIFHAVACGCRHFTALLITGDSKDLTAPCGACRQVMAEFSIPEIILVRPDDSYETFTLQQLLPLNFDESSMA